jgi:outer membrane biosynthesis protein TonB
VVDQTRVWVSLLQEESQKWEAAQEEARRREESRLAAEAATSKAASPVVAGSHPAEAEVTEEVEPVKAPTVKVKEERECIISPGTVSSPPESKEEIVEEEPTPPPKVSLEKTEVKKKKKKKKAEEPHQEEKEKSVKKENSFKERQSPKEKAEELIPFTKKEETLRQSKAKPLEVAAAHSFSTEETSTRAGQSPIELAGRRSGWAALYS